MDREQRILDYNKRDTTMIVSRKPSPSQGNNGDLAAGNTAQGPMLFSKVNNKWYSIKPRKVPARQDVTFEGAINLIYGSWIPTYAGSWLALGATFETQHYQQNAPKDSSDNEKLAMFLNHDTSIKNFTLRSSSAIGNTTIRLYVLEEGGSDWDTESGSSYIGSSGPSFVESVTVNVSEAGKLYNFKFNKEYKIPKYSLVMMHATVTTTGGTSIIYQIQLEFDE